MSLSHEFLLLAGVPLAVILVLLAGHLATLRGLRGGHRVAAFQAFADAVRRRR
ncbi:hypothetical protein [Streptomyces sp. YU58]|uniref:hypothetical protein n=1 Tax=Streptomyces sp. SX92 TaxID=3158972 RepID=UPI0027BA18EC|nr:hypothetical protein [Streptomyces coralus]WLW55949.1 hypothetical protein QU709_33440 [Streptomyces coralus]